MNILLVCAGGISTSFFVQNIRHEFEEQKIEGSVMAKSITEVPEFINMVDIIFIAPQAVFFKEKVEKIADPRITASNTPRTWGMLKFSSICNRKAIRYTMTACTNPRTPEENAFPRTRALRGAGSPAVCEQSPCLFPR